MRTREEQISELRTQIFNADCFTSLSKAKEKAESYIFEAERRAEQRVREEILHRVTSDENKDRYEEIKEYAEGMSKEFWSTCLKLHPDQDYSSLSAVSIFRCGYDLGAKETQERIGRDSERLDWLASCLIDIRINKLTVSSKRPRYTKTITVSGPLPSFHFRVAIDAAREGE
ncbi:hypothetical protein [Acetobacter senegalensis]|uniref:hypothetical protein n=1 Tax=Acetobacter senegalensis TaxID=446692 RepID=UPI001EDAA4B8|nr:hypothetical protein [Acetobacter senegalensis]MCG4258162.1 hypothetical protein [Acetobacter senegalensis]MCG4268089.1 hypothetical protein [Acetobacter senegalensis]